MEAFLINWGQAAYTSFGFFWMALWAFILGYLLSSMIQILVTEERMQSAMGGSGWRQVALGTFFGFISSSCSFSALASTKSLFQKGASFVSSIAFLLASTNLVIELGIIISVFLGWQFVVGEYVGGLLLVVISWMLIKVINPKKLIQEARSRLKDHQEQPNPEISIWERFQRRKSWIKIAKQYAMEWKMVWKDVTIGFTVAGIVAVFIPNQFFEWLFINSGTQSADFSFWELLQHVVVGPVAAFCTFIGSMGNIPLAALLFDKGVSFAGVMAFIFSDLVVFPVLRINAKYYGWRMSFFILFLLFSALIISALSLHYGLDVLSLLPKPGSSELMQRSFFKVDYTLYLNIGFLIISAFLIYKGFFKDQGVKHHKEMAPKNPLFEQILLILSIVSYVWLIVGMALHYYFG